MVNFPEEKDILDRQYWLDKVQGKIIGPQDPKKKIKKKTAKQLKEERFHGALHFAPDEIKKDREIVLLALEHANEYFSNVDESLQDKEFILEYVKKVKYPSFLSLPKEFRIDDDIFLEIFKKDASSFRYFVWDSNRYSNKDGVKKLIEMNPEVIEFLSDKYKDDIELAKMVIDKNPKLIMYLKKGTTEKICVDKEYCQDLLSKNMYAFPYLNIKLRGDKEFVLPYVKRYPPFLKNLSKKLKNDKSFMEQFIGKHYIHCLLDYAGDDLLKDEEFMLKAISFYPHSIYYADKSLRNKDFYIKAVKLTPNAYVSLYESLQLDDDLIYTLLTHETYVNKEDKQESTIDLIHPKKIRECQDEYSKLPKNGPLITDKPVGYEQFIRLKFTTLYLMNNLNDKDDAEYKISSKRLKI